MTTDSKLEFDMDKLNACIHCGFCLSVCPTYRVTGSEAESPRGRLYLMRGFSQGKLDTTEQLTKHLDPCLACHACETACPSGVEYGHLLLETREKLAQQNNSLGRFVRRFAFNYILPNKALLHVMASAIRLYQAMGIDRLIQKSGLLAPWPSLVAMVDLLPKLSKEKRLYTGMSFGNPSGKRVALLTGCVMDAFQTSVHWATARVLAANGYYVTIPPQGCCGALAHHAGETDITRKLAKQNILWIREQNPDYIVVNSAGCGSTLKEYDQLLKDDIVYADKAKWFSNKIVDVMELLAEKPLAKFSRTLDATVTYHAACHLHHVQGVKTQTQSLLEQVPGLKLVPLTEYDICCGSAGIYNIQHPELADEILDVKMKHIKEAYEASGAEAVVTGNPGCMMQIAKGMRGNGLPMRVAHPVEYLAQAYEQN